MEECVENMTDNIMLCLRKDIPVIGFGYRDSNSEEMIVKGKAGEPMHWNSLKDRTGWKSSEGGKEEWQCSPTELPSKS